jgi:hypothetical protein
MEETENAVMVSTRLKQATRQEVVRRHERDREAWQPPVGPSGRQGLEDRIVPSVTPHGEPVLSNGNPTRKENTMFRTLSQAMNRLTSRGRKLWGENRKRKSRSPRARLQLETLEDRQVPSTMADIRPIFEVFTPAAGAAASGYSPAQIRAAYSINGIRFGSKIGDGSGQTIAIVDMYNDPNIFADLNRFDQFFRASASGATLYQQYGAASAFLTVYDQNGHVINPMRTSVPVDSTGGWEGEEALDVEWAHAMAPGARIDLIECSSDPFAGVVSAAGLPGVSVVSMSWGMAEAQGETSYDSTFTTPSGHQGVTFLASTGDESYGSYPAFSPNVIAVGGTTLKLDAHGHILGETGWSTGSDSWNPALGTGGGTSQYESAPAFQNGFQSTGMRTTPDVSFDADPATGVAIYDSFKTSAPWLEIGGTSLACPAWAGLIAIANQGRHLAGHSTFNSSSNPQQAAQALYNVSATDFHDITVGSISANGVTYSAGAGYDEVTGRGTPVANLLLADLAHNSGGGGGGGGNGGGGGGTATYELINNGDLLKIQSGVSTVIDTNIETYGATSSGALFDLTNAGVFKQFFAGSWHQLDSNVQWICVGANGSLYDLQKGGTLWGSSVGSSWHQVDTQVESITVSAGALFDLERSGNLWEYVNSSWYRIDSGVAQFTATANGAIYDLERGGTLYAASAVGASWHVMDSNVQSIATTPGGALFDLERGGNLWEYVNGNWYQIDSNVQSFWATADGAIYDLQRGGTLYGANGGGWYVVDYNVATFYATLGGQLYDLERSGTLWANTNGSWFVMDNSVQAFYATYNGSIYDLQQSGNLWANTGNGWFQMDSGVKEFAATYCGWLYDLQNGGNFYANYTGSWFLVHSGVSSFVLNQDGSATYYF